MYLIASCYFEFSVEAQFVGGAGVLNLVQTPFHGFVFCLLSPKCSKMPSRRAKARSLCIESLSDKLTLMELKLLVMQQIDDEVLQKVTQVVFYFEKESQIADLSQTIAQIGILTQNPVYFSVCFIAFIQFTKINPHCTELIDETFEEIRGTDFLDQRPEVGFRNSAMLE